MSDFYKGYYEDHCFAHHGILGQKWGVRRFQNKDGSLTSEGKSRYKKDENGDFTIPKGSNIYRLSNSREDKTYDNKKYVSLNTEDHRKWQKYLGDTYNKRGQQAYNVIYESVNDLKIANYEKVGQIWLEKKLKDPEYGKRSVDDTIFSAKSLGQKVSKDANEMLSLNFAMQTKTGKEFIEDLMNRGYQGVEDKHGQNVSKDPVIIFDPDKNLKRSGVTLYQPKRMLNEIGDKIQKLPKGMSDDELDKSFEKITTSVVKKSKAGKSK